MGTPKPDDESGSRVGSPDTAREFPHLAGVTHRFVDADGLRMHVAEAGSGRPLLLLHGFPQHWWGWRKVLPALAENFHVISPDLRGAGWTDAPPDGYTSDQLVADVIALLDALNIEQTDILGYDWGGHVGFRICLSHPERVRRFLCLATPHPYPEFHPRVLLSVWRLWPMFATAVPRLGPRLLGSGRQRLPRSMMTGDTDDPSVWSEDDLDLFLSRLREPARAQAGSALYRDFILKETNRAAAGAYRQTRLTIPTLSLYGTVLYGNDHPRSEHPEILGGFENYADDFTLAHVPGAGYYIAEEQPQDVIDHARAFFSVHSR